MAFVDEDSLAKAIQELRLGRVVSIPTETVYGLAGRIDSAQAVEEIFKVKKRPFFDPLIVHVADIDQARGLVSAWPAQAEILAKTFWPGPLTLVLKKNSQVSDLITSGLDTVGLRCPRHSLARAVIQGVGVPLAAPSANRFGRTSPTSAEHVLREFPGEAVFVLDGGSCDVGIESTIVDLSLADEGGPLRLLRRGQVTQSDLDQSLRHRGVVSSWVENSGEVNLEGSPQVGPGRLKHHYMPEIPILSVEAGVRPEFSEGGESSSSGSLVRFLSPSPALSLLLKRKLDQLPLSWHGVALRPSRPLSRLAALTVDPEPALAARALYSQLRILSASGADGIVWFKDQVPAEEIWMGYLDRLTRATSISIESEDLR